MTMLPRRGRSGDALERRRRRRMPRGLSMVPLLLWRGFYSGAAAVVTMASFVALREVEVSDAGGDPIVGLLQLVSHRLAG